jgi:hypothetical protein
VKAKGPKTERETVIRWSEDGEKASIWTASQPVYRKLLKLGHKPTEDNERSAIFDVPKRCVSIRRARTLTDKQQEALQTHGFAVGRPRLSRKVGT